MFAKKQIVWAKNLEARRAMGIPLGKQTVEEGEHVDGAGAVAADGSHFEDSDDDFEGGDVDGNESSDFWDDIDEFIEDVMGDEEGELLLEEEVKEKKKKKKKKKKKSKDKDKEKKKKKKKVRLFLVLYLICVAVLHTWFWTDLQLSVLIAPTGRERQPNSLELTK